MGSAQRLLDDPVLRYMMDALAADQLLGESPPEMFAFGSYRKGGKGSQSNEWRAKNVTPILYREYRLHTYLHRTLRVWAQMYRDGVRGKEHIVTEYAMALPDTAASDDDFVSRMLWALSDPTGLPARRFADFEPVPSLDWLEPLTDNRFGQADLSRFDVPPKEKVDGRLRFNLLRRPAPYDLAPQMALADSVAPRSRCDKVMWELSRWLVRHLNNPDLVLWVIKQGGILHYQMAERIARRLIEIFDLEVAGNDTDLERIRASAHDAIPDARMRTLWGLLLAQRVGLAGQELDLDGWRRRFVRHGPTTALRLELIEMLAPRVILTEPFAWPFEDDDNHEDDDEVEPGPLRELFDCDIELAASNVHETLGGLRGNERWSGALPSLLADITALLRDALDLMRDLGAADDQSDFSYVDQPSISEHAQNSALRDWTALIELNRDAWRAMAAESPDRARLTAQTWSQLPYPVFRRLAFFAAAQGDVIPTGKGLDWLLADDGWWLWSIETQRETMRLLVALAPRINEQELPRLEHAILNGPPRNMFKPDLDEQRWTEIKDEDIWLRLAKISQAGAQLNDAARERLNGLSAQHPDWQLANDERDEFPSWTGDGSELLAHVTTPRQRDELVEWLREHPQPDQWRPDDWRQRCREDFDDAAIALTELAQEGTWPTGRWREALQVWSEGEQSEHAWREVGPVLRGVPAAELQQFAHAVGWWLQNLARVFEEQVATFLSLCDAVLALDYQHEEPEDDIVGRAINHPVGHVTEALLRWWYRAELKDDQGLAEEPRRRFIRLCDTETPIFRHGRVLLATHLISLFRVDREWTTQHLIPLFTWQDADAEARSAWVGFLQSARLYPPLMEVLKPAFLDTANHYDRLGRHARQYAWLLTFAGLDSADVFRSRELGLAMRALPRNALKHAANAVSRAVDGAGDQRAEYWRNRAAPYLDAIWPKTPQMRSEGVSENFARACIAAGDAFAEAVGQVHAWLQPLPFPDRIAHALRRAEIDSRFPERALELLHRIVADDARAFFMHLPRSLSVIRTVEPQLEHGHRFQRLVAILRANGVELD